MSELSKSKKINENDEEDDHQKKRNPRKGIELGKIHPLKINGYKWFVRTKFCTPIFEGKPIPACPKNDFDVIGVTE